MMLQRLSPTGGLSSLGALPIGALLALVLVWVLPRGPFHRTELGAYDLHFSHRGGQPAHDNVVLVGVDQTSLDALAHGRTPVPRHWVASAIDFLHRAHARAIGLDFLYDAPSVYGRRDDAAFARAIGRAGNVVLAQEVTTIAATSDIASGSQLVSPMAAFARNAAGVGMTGVNLDEDNTVRSVDLVQTGPAGRHPTSYPAFAAVLAAAALHRPVATVLGGLPRRQMLINFAGPQDPADPARRSFPMYQLQTVATGQDNPDLFRGKIILIVPADPLSRDQLNTPFGQMYGGAVNANVLTTILDRDPIVPAGDGLDAICILIMGLIGAFVAARLDPWRIVVVVPLAAGAYLALNGWLFTTFRLWIYLVEPETALLATFTVVLLFRFIRTALVNRRLLQRSELYQRLQAAHSKLEAQHAQLLQAQRELAEARDEALQANQAKSAFLANVSHELRTPLNAIIGYSELLIEDAEDGGQQSLADDLNKIHAAGKHLLELINEVLDLSKVEAGRMELFPETFDLPALVREVAGTIGPLAEKRANILRVRCADDLGAMHADRTKVRQILLNLLSNACKFTDHGTITLEAGRQADEIVFRVSDTGIGMTDAQLGRLFQPFSQADASIQARYGGTGLGLALSRRFCHMMQGDITVVSQTGQGTVFTVTLPTHVAAAGDTRLAALQPQAVSSGRADA